MVQHLRTERTVRSRYKSTVHIIHSFKKYLLRDHYVSDLGLDVEDLGMTKVRDTVLNLKHLTALGGGSESAQLLGTWTISHCTVQ